MKKKTVMEMEIKKTHTHTKSDGEQNVWSKNNKILI